MSTLKVSNIQATGETASRAVSGVAAAWANINGTPATRDSQNVSSITDNGTGDHSISFSSSMGNDDYASSMATHYGVVYVSQSGGVPQGYATTGIRINTINASSLTTKADKDSYYIATHGDLA